MTDTKMAKFLAVLATLFWSGWFGTIIFKMNAIIIVSTMMVAIVLTALAFLLSNTQRVWTSNGYRHKKMKMPPSPAEMRKIKAAKRKQELKRLQREQEQHLIGDLYTNNTQFYRRPRKIHEKDQIL